MGIKKKVYFCAVIFGWHVHWKMCCHGGGMVDTRDLKSLAHCGRVGSSPTRGTISGSSSVGRAQPCQGWGREFESRFPLKDNEKPGLWTGLFYFKSLTTRRIFFERSLPYFGFSPKSVQESVTTGNTLQVLIYSVISIWKGWIREP